MGRKYNWLYFFIPSIFLASAQVQKIYLPNFCYNDRHKDSRLITNLFMTTHVSGQMDCLIECDKEPCCRSINFRKKSSSHDDQNCEMLHNVVYNTSEILLQMNTSFDHVYFIGSKKEYNASCLFPKGYWKNIATDICVGAKNDSYKEIKYSGPSKFITAMKLVHKEGQIGCNKREGTNWGCKNSQHTGIIVTDTTNQRMYPSPKLIYVHSNGWYDLPGYGVDAQELVFTDPGFRFLYNGQRMKIWYGEDLYDYTESDNHGHTCMDVYVYVENV